MASKNPFLIDPERLKSRLSETVYLEELKTDPDAALEKVRAQKTPLETDKWIYRWVVFALGLAVLMTIGGAIYLAAKEPPVPSTPEILVAIGSASVGALAGLLAPSPKSS